jgi:hypothetical protein
VSSIFPLFPFFSFLFSSPLSLAVWGNDGATRVAAERMEAARATAWGSYSRAWPWLGGDRWEGVKDYVEGSDVPCTGLGRSGAAGDQIGEGNFESHAVGEGTVVAGGGCGCGQGDGVMVRVGL